MGVAEEAGKVATSAVESMKSAPLAIALLLVNCIFIGFNGYILSAVASNAAERNKTQMELIVQLVGDIRDCRLVPKTNSLLRLYPPPARLQFQFQHPFDQQLVIRPQPLGFVLQPSAPLLQNLDLRLEQGNKLYAMPHHSSLAWKAPAASPSTKVGSAG